MRFNKEKITQIGKAAGVASASVMLFFLLGATEINIGVDNQVNTGKVVGGNCLQGNGKLTKKHLELLEFKDISVDGVFSVNVVCGKKSELVVTADDNLHSLISTSVKNGKLHISTRGSYCTSNSFVVDIALQQLASIAADGSSELVVNCNNFAQEKLVLELRGTSVLTLSGKAKNVAVTVQDSTELEAYHLTAETVHIKASDAATAKVHVTQKLTGESSDASTITYRGKPKMVQVQTSDASECSPEE